MRYADGPQVECDVHVAADPARVWELVTDIELPTRFSPELRSVRWLDGATGPVPGARSRGGTATLCWASGGPCRTWSSWTPHGCSAGLWWTRTTGSVRLHLTRDTRWPPGGSSSRPRTVALGYGMAPGSGRPARGSAWRSTGHRRRRRCWCGAGSTTCAPASSGPWPGSGLSPRELGRPILREVRFAALRRGTGLPPLVRADGRWEDRRHRGC